MHGALDRAQQILSTVQAGFPPKARCRYEDLMQRLILMRHAKAERDSDTGQDFDRPLSPRGETEALKMGQVLRDAGFIPDVALVSAAKRTSQTWGLASQAFGSVPAEFHRSIYNAAVFTLREMAEARSEDCVMVVGHNPSIQDLALVLLREANASAAVIARAAAKFPPATAVAFAINAAQHPVYDGLFFVADHGVED